MTHNLIRRRFLIVALALAVLAGAVYLSVGPAAADSTLSQLQLAQATKANCQLLAAHSSGAQRTRAQQCVTDQTAIIGLLTAVPTPTSTRTSSPTPTMSPPTTPPTTTPPATTPPVTTPPATTPPPSPSPTSTSSPAAWPDSTNTGAGDCSKLTPSDGMTITTDGTVVEGLAVTGQIRVEANNVVIRHVCFTNTSEQDWAIVQWFSGSGLLVQDVTIRGNAIIAMGQGVQNFGGDITVQRADIAGVADGVATIRGLIEDSYIHDPSTLNGAHVDLIQATSGADDGDMLTVRHNTLLNPQRQTGAVSLFQDFGIGRHARIVGNLLAGGGYSIYAGGGPMGLSYDIQITDNVFDRRYFPQCGANGPVIAFDTGGSGNVWARNAYDNGVPLAP